MKTRIDDNEDANMQTSLSLDFIATARTDLVANDFGNVDQKGVDLK